MILKGVMIKVTDIRILDDLEEIDIENDNVDVFVETDDGYTYTLSFATPKHLQFLMEKEKMDYYGPGYPFRIVTKLTPEIIKASVKDLADEIDGGYWLKIYHFAGWRGAIDENIFDQLKAKHVKERREFDKFMKLDLMWETKRTLKNLLNKTDLIHLVEKYRSGNTHSAIKIRAVPDTCLNELRTRSGTRIYFQKKNNIIEVVAICDKDNQKRVIELLSWVYRNKEIF